MSDKPSPSPPAPGGSSSGTALLLLAAAALTVAIVWLVRLRGAPATAGPAATAPAPLDDEGAVRQILRATSYLSLDGVERLPDGGLRARITFHASPTGSSVVGVGAPVGAPHDVARTMLLEDLGPVVAPLQQRGVRELAVAVELIVESAGPDKNDKTVVVEQDRVAIGAVSLDGLDLDAGVSVPRLAPTVKELSSTWSKYEMRADDE